MCKAYFQKSTWDSYNEYKIWSDSMHVNEINNEIWELSICSCQYWKKNFISKHGYQLELLEFPDLKIEKNSLRGR